MNDFPTAHETNAEATSEAATSATASRPQEQQPERITWMVLSSLALVAGLGIAAANGDWWTVSGTRLVGIGIVLIGAGVVAGQLRGGGAKGLIPLGILAFLALIPVAAVEGLRGDGHGESVYRPQSIEELQSSYQHGMGELTVDLSAIDFEGNDTSLDIELGMGKLIVIVSEETGGSVALHASAGQVTYQSSDASSDSKNAGVGVNSGTLVLAGDNGSVDLDISVGFGTVELRSAAS